MQPVIVQRSCVQVDDFSTRCHPTLLPCGSQATATGAELWTLDAHFEPVEGLRCRYLSV